MFISRYHQYQDMQRRFLILRTTENGTGAIDNNGDLCRLRQRRTSGIKLI